ncbi:MAG TPA: hypothetical protein PK090_03805 [Smithellaceae bacterium]|nr:hypothetical protein [Smithellaceae bacterium]
MDQKQVFQQMIEFNKAAFDNSFGAMSGLQDQTEKMLLSFLDKTPWIPQDGKKVISEWIASYKKGREEFKAAADEQYKKVAAYFDKAMKPESGKAGRKS